MQLKITHKTVYKYDEPIPYGLQQVRLTPKSRAGQNVINWQMQTEGGNKELEFEDQHNNKVQLINIDEGQSEISILCDGLVETNNNNGVVGEHGGYMPLWCFKRETDLTKPGKHLKAFVKSIDAKTDNDVSLMHHLSGSILEKMAYQTGISNSLTTAEQAVYSGQGVCQDHAHVMISCARMMDFPARYISGYLMMNDRVNQEASHAWVEVYCRDIGWVGFDVSNGISPDERYIRVATGLDYHDAAPISGIRLGNSDESMNVSIQVQQ